MGNKALGQGQLGVRHTPLISALQSQRHVDLLSSRPTMCTQTLPQKERNFKGWRLTYWFRALAAFVQDLDLFPAPHGDS